MQISTEIQQRTVELQARIKMLSEFEGESLQNAMSDLKRAIMENPDASLLLLPEDIGEIVSKLRQITGKALQSAAAKKEKAATKKDKAPEKALKTMTQEELEAGWGDL